MDKQTLIEALNGDLANEYAAIIQYNTYAASVKGPHREELRRFFQTEIPDEQLHAQFLADKIVTLGGKPTTTPSAVTSAESAEDMLRAVLEAEQKAVAGYTERIGQADAVGDIALRVQLENFVADESKHRDEVELMLAGWR